MFTTNGPPTRWEIKHFTARAVYVPTNYRRCEHEVDGIRCENVYKGGRGTHKHCATHRELRRKKSPPTWEAICGECGKSFLAHRKRRNYCSRSCSCTAAARIRNGK